MEDRFARDNVIFNPLRFLRSFVVDFLCFLTAVRTPSCLILPFANTNRVNCGFRFEILNQRVYDYDSSEIKTVKTIGWFLSLQRRSDQLFHYYI